MRYKSKNRYPISLTSNHGYTIVEVLIFLAVSTILGVSAFRVVGGQQSKTQFAQGVRDFELRLQDIINDVATGYYVNTNTYKCDGGAAPNITSIARPQGTNIDCIVLGQVIQFGQDGGQQIRIIPVVGLRRTSLGQEVVNMSEARPMPIAPTVTNPGISNPNGTTSEVLQNGVRIEKVTYNSGTNVGAIGFMTNFAVAEVEGNLDSSSRTADLYPIPSTTITSSETQVAEQIKAMTDANKNPAQGIIVCLTGSARGLVAEIIIGSNGRQLTTKLEIKSACT